MIRRNGHQRCGFVSFQNRGHRRGTGKVVREESWLAMSNTPEAQRTLTVVRPQVCPFCGEDLLAVCIRRVTGNIYEVYCDACNMGAVIHSGDQIALPKGKP